MAGDWIKMRTDLTDDPSVIRIADLTGLDEFAVVGRLHTLWAWADRHTQDGEIPAVTDRWIDRTVKHEGFAAAMQDAGWLCLENGVSFPKFDRHNGESAKTRAMTTRRKQRQRVKNPDFEECHGDVTEMSRYDRDKSVTREEKRREEKEEDSEPSALRLVPGRVHATEPQVQQEHAEGDAEENEQRKRHIPAPERDTSSVQRLNRGEDPRTHPHRSSVARARDGPARVIAWSASTGWFGVTDQDRAEWGEAYPACNLDRQLAAMHQWLLANPAKARKKSWRRFVTNWLERAQERGGDARSNKPAGRGERLGKVEAAPGKYDRYDHPQAHG